MLSIPHSTFHTPHFTLNEGSCVDRQIRFDISCTFNGGELADVEMTTSPGKNEAARMEYYLSRLFTTQNIRGKGRRYDELKHTYQINIVGENILKGSDYSHYCSFTDQYGENLGGRMHIIVLELQKLSKVIEKPINEMSKQDLWGLFFKCIPDKSRRELMNEISKREEGIAMACALLKTMSQDEHTRARLETELKNKVECGMWKVELKI